MKRSALLALALVLVLAGCGEDAPPAAALDTIEGAPIDAPVEPAGPKPIEGLPPVDEDGVQAVPFQFLASYDYVYAEPGEEAPRNQIPAKVLALAGRRVAIDGFILPTELAGGKVTRFLLARYPFGCCFGAGPGTNEYVDVIVPGPEGLEAIPFGAARVVGPLEVGEARDEAGYVTSLYRLVAERVDDAPGLVHPDQQGGQPGG